MKRRCRPQGEGQARREPNVRPTPENGCLGKRAARLAAAIVATLIAAPAPAGAADPDALWKIVHDRCVPDAQQRGDPAPCAMVDLREGTANGYAVLKDLVGIAQFLL